MKHDLYVTLVMSETNKLRTKDNPIGICAN